MTVTWISRVLALLAVAVAVLAVLYGLALSQISGQANDNAVTGRALCALRSNLEKRGDQSNDFLREHPNGAGNIPPAVIVKSIRDTRSTLHALRILKC